MSDLGAEQISLVLPTFNRARALRENLAGMLALEGVGEVIVVDDGSSDDTLAVCAGFAQDERLKVVSHPENRGVARARNTGVEAARGSWILFGEDDCRFPSDYAATLRAEGERLAADIVGAPLLFIPGAGEEVEAVAARAPRRTRPPTMDEDNVFPREAMFTPFLPARVIVRRAVFERVRFYEGFTSNGYREETDFFVQAARSGFRCALTPETYCYQVDSWSGGQHHSSSLRYEYWTLRNNWRFLRRHGGWLADQGYIESTPRAQLQFTLMRVRGVAGGALRARVARLRAALANRDRGALTRRSKRYK